MEAFLNRNYLKFFLNKNNKNKYIKLFCKKDVFQPTETTKFLIQAIKINPSRKKVKILDLGCGNGVVGIYLLKKFKNIESVTFVDVSKKAIANAQENCLLNKLSKKKTLFLQSNIFEKINNVKFDIIINDISGISYTVAKISNWFKNVPCESGDDGTKLTLNVLKNFKLFLNKRGEIYYPIISLSNEKRIFNYLKKKNIEAKTVSINEWPIPKEMYNHSSLFKKLKKLNKINYENKYGLMIANTKIFKIKLDK